jgi:hypothetical protein
VPRKPNQNALQNSPSSNLAARPELLGAASAAKQPSFGCLFNHSKGLDARTGCQVQKTLMQFGTLWKPHQYFFGDTWAARDALLNFLK